MTTTYFVKAEGDCDSTTCINTTIEVMTVPVAPMNVSVSDGDYEDKIHIS